MKAELEGTRRIALLDQREFIEFYSPEQAESFLLQFIHDPFNMSTLRSSLGEQLPGLIVSALSDFEVIRYLAPRLVQVCVAFVRSQMPPTIPADVAEGALEKEEIEMSRPLTEDEEVTFEEIKPEPVIPPEYPRLAKKEGDKVEFESDRFQVRLDLLRFVGMGTEDESEVAKAFDVVSKGSAEALAEATSGFGAKLVLLVKEESGVLGTSEIMQALKGVVGGQRKSLLDSSDEMGVALEKMLQGQRDLSSSEVSPAMRALAERQKLKLEESSLSFVSTLNTLTGEPGEAPKPSQIARTLSQLTGGQGETLLKLGAQTGMLLEQLGEERLTEPPEPSQLIQSMKLADTEQQQGFLRATEKMALRLGGLVPGGAPPPPPKSSGSETLISMKDSTRRQQEALSEGADQFAERLMGALSSDTSQLKQLRPEPFAPKLRERVFMPLPDGREPSPKRDWIELELASRWGDPLEGQAFRLELQDGSVKEGKLDSMGRIRLSGLAEGDCRLQFPEMEWPWHQKGGEQPNIQLYTVKRGDWLSKIALQFGIKSWLDIYDHPCNESFKLKRPDPDFIQVGDQIYIPGAEGDHSEELETGFAYSLRALDPLSGAPEPEVEKPEVEEPEEPEVEEPEVEDPKEYYLLLDSETGLLYRIHTQMLEQMKGASRGLEKIKKELKAAKKAGGDQQANAVEMSLQELHDYCQITPDPDPDPLTEKAPTGRRRQRWHELGRESPIREFVALQGRNFVYVPRGKQDEIEGRFRDRWRKGPLKDALQMEREDIEGGNQAASFELKFSSSWKTQGDGSLFDLLDSHDPKSWAMVLANPTLAPVALLDYVGEKFPRFFRKTHQGKWAWDKELDWFEGGWEARFARWSYDAQAFEGIWDPRNGNIQAVGKANISASLFSGKVDADIRIPDKDGFKLPLPVSSGEPFKLRISVETKLSGFVGAVAELNYQAVVDWSVDDAKPDGKCPMEIGLGGGLNAFAGASATAEAMLVLEWYNPSLPKWKALAKIGGTATGFVGAALQAAFNLGWDPARQVFLFEVRVGIALKFGGGAGVKGEADVGEIITFIGELLKRVDYHRISEIAGDAFERYTELTIAWAIAPGASLAVAGALKLAEAFFGWAGDQTEIRDLAENINTGRAKQLLDQGSPEAKAAILRKLVERSMFLSDEPEEEAIIKILKSIPSKRGLIKTLKKVDLDDMSIEGGIDLIDGAVDWAEQDSFNSILEGYGLR